MAENHGAPEAEKLSMVWTRGHRGTESRQRIRGAISPSWAVQNEMKGVLGRISQALHDVFLILLILKR